MEQPVVARAGIWNFDVAAVVALTVVAVETVAAAVVGCYETETAESVVAVETVVAKAVVVAKVVVVVAKVAVVVEGCMTVESWVGALGGLEVLQSRCGEDWLVVGHWMDFEVQTQPAEQFKHVISP